MTVPLGPPLSAALAVTVGAAVLWVGLLLIHHIDFSSDTLLERYAAYCNRIGQPPRDVEIDYLLGAADDHDLDPITARALRSIRRGTHSSPLATLARRRHHYVLHSWASGAGDGAANRPDRAVSVSGRLPDTSRPVVAYMDAHDDASSEESFIPSSEAIQ